jgi:pimeloyl-ACP methyl ester carboxylesterase
MFCFQIPWLPERLLALGNHRFIDSLRDGAAHPENFPDEVLAVFRANAAGPGALRAMLHYYRALLRGGGLRRQLAQGTPPIEVPTLLVWGERDVALRLETTRGTERFAPDLTLRTLPGISHFVQQDAPEAVNEIVEAWLLGRPVPGA